MRWADKLSAELNDTAPLHFPGDDSNKLFCFVKAEDEAQQTNLFPDSIPFLHSGPI